MCGWVLASKETVCVFSVWSVGRKRCCSLGVKALPCSQSGSRFAGRKGHMKTGKCSAVQECNFKNSCMLRNQCITVHFLNAP